MDSWLDSQLEIFSTREFEELQQKEFELWKDRKWLIYRPKQNSWVVNNQKISEWKNYTSEYIKVFGDIKLAVFYLRANPANDSPALANPLTHKCAVCGKVLMPYKYKRFTATCSDECKKIYTKRVYIENFGVDNPNKSPSVIEKTKQTNLKKYGVKYYTQSPEYIIKKKKTLLNKYNVKSYSQTDEYKRKIKDTCLQKYGVDSYSKTREFIDAIKSTNRQKWGVDYYSQTDESKERIKQTLKEKYGQENYNNRDKAVQTCIEKYNDKNYNNKNKIKATKLERYNNENYNNTSKIKSTWAQKTEQEIKAIVEKSKQACLQKYNTPYYNNPEKTLQTNNSKYGIDNYAKTSECKEKVKQTYINKYGADHFMRAESWRNTNIKTLLEKAKQTKANNIKINPNYYRDIKDKYKKTCLNKYGVEHFSQSTLFHKYHKTRYRYEEQNFDSSWELYYYIYHKEILKDDIKRNTDIHLTYYVNDIKKVYTPDFLLSSKLIEVKGNHFFKGDQKKELEGQMINPFDRGKDNEYQAKYECMKENGVEVLTGKEVLPIIQKVQNKYGKNYIEQYKINE